MGTFIQWKNFEALLPYANMFKEGLITTVLLALFTVLIGFVLGLLLSVMRMSNIRPFLWLAHAFPGVFGFLERDKSGLLRDSGFLYHLGRFNPLSFLATAYVEVIRSTPVLVQVMVIYFGVFSQLFSLPSFKIFGFIAFNRFFPGVVALAMNSGAYLCEIIRSGIQSIDGGQTEAARSLGLSQGQNMRFIILPQAIKNILPAIGNEFVTMVKETAIIQYLGISDLMYNNGIVVTATYNPLPCYYISAIIYLALNIILGRGMNIFERRLKKSER